MTRRKEGRERWLAQEARRREKRLAQVSKWLGLTVPITDCFSFVVPPNEGDPDYSLYCRFPDEWLRSWAHYNLEWCFAGPVGNGRCSKQQINTPLHVRRAIFAATGQKPKVLPKETWDRAIYELRYHRSSGGRPETRILTWQEVDVLFPPDAQREDHALYRFFDRNGSLLYVGITMSPVERWRAHRDGKPWWISVDTIKVEHCADRRAALAAEKRAILREKPLYNIVHNKRRRKTVETEKSWLESRPQAPRGNDHDTTLR